MTQDRPVEELVRRAQGCDRKAFAELSDLYRRRVEALALSRMSPALRRRLSVEDVVQETMTRAFASIAQFQWRGEESFLRWLGTISRNVIAVRCQWDTVDRLYTALLQSAERPFAGFEKELRLRRGRVAFKRGQYRRAERDFAVVREASRRAIGPTMLLATAYYNADQRDEADAVLREALAENQSAEAALSVAYLHRHFGEEKKAREVVEMITDEASKQAALVLFLLREGKRNEAVEAGRRALSIRPDDPWVHAAMGDALWGARRMQEARAFLEESHCPGSR